MTFCAGGGGGGGGAVIVPTLTVGPGAEFVGFSLLKSGYDLMYFHQLRLRLKIHSTGR